MAAFVSSLSPIPSFPDYTGPFKVGTVDVEIPVSELVSPSPAPEGAADIQTVLFRVFYPAVPESQGKRVSWLPAPQRLHIAAYTQFLGAGSTLASILSFLPRHLHWTSIPAYKNATLLAPPSDRSRSRWPTMIFSHGLGGNRNGYSYLAGSLASYGVVVVCPEHRDGSAALSLIRDPKNQNRKSTRHMVPYLRIAHTQTHEAWEARNKQLRIRLWELGLTFEALLAIDGGDQPIISSNLNYSTPESALAQFANALDILDPGRVIFSGHSFGAATITQLLKSTFYAGHPSLAPNLYPNPLFTPSQSSAIVAQITPSTPTILLDMWCFPLLSASTAPLYNLPLPCYSLPNGRGPGGAALLAVESQAFYNWTEHLHAKARILSPSPTCRTVTADMFDDDNGTDDTDMDDENPKTERSGQKKPNFFYVASSAHLNQSDFGVLFPWLTKRVFKASQPERVLRLNVRAQLQFLRENDVVVAGTAWRDVMVDDLHYRVKSTGQGDWVAQDDAILKKAGAAGEGEVEAWKWIDVVGLGGESGPSELEMQKGETGVEDEVRAEEGEREMQGEMEPSLERGVESVA
ncbi:PAF acetylhydrolase [Parathielavia appendiculata]|uniref:Putative phospholipase n=1 Tax=Parathielavia appendiculata TaxID=2587402 RepID=A0AAN6UA14_9PEZI|nr:PAF acetylhydrolase [Parathielavia appendiculata]